jgi:hypothetical protein
MEMQIDLIKLHITDKTERGKRLDLYKLRVVFRLVIIISHSAVSQITGRFRPGMFRLTQRRCRSYSRQQKMINIAMAR